MARLRGVYGVAGFDGRFPMRRGLPVRSLDPFIPRVPPWPGPPPPGWTKGKTQGAVKGVPGMATHVSDAPRRGFQRSWLPVVIAGVLVVTLVGVAFAVGRNSGSRSAGAGVPTHANVGPRVTAMMPWMQGHVGDVAWMRSHMGDVTWMRSHWSQWQWVQSHIGDLRWMQTHRVQWMWMQAHPAQWRWMQIHMGEIGWMHDHYGQWTGWRSGMGYGTSSGSNGTNGSMTGSGGGMGSGPNGSMTGSGGGWDCGPWC